MFHTAVGSYLIRATNHCDHMKPLVLFKYFLVPELCHLGRPWLALGSQFDVPGAVVCPTAPKRTYGTAPMVVVWCKSFYKQHKWARQIGLWVAMKFFVVLAMAPLPLERRGEVRADITILGN